MEQIAPKRFSETEIAQDSRNTPEEAAALAPFPPGVRVRVAKIIDEAGDTAFVGKEGVVTEHDYDSGVGQGPHDPMIRIDFGDGLTDSFWKEELELVA